VQSAYWEYNSHSASQEIPRLLWNRKVYYRIHKSLPVGHILSQFDPVSTFKIYSSKINFDIILMRMASYPTWPLTLRFQTKYSPMHIIISMRITSLFLPCVLHVPPISFSVDLITLTALGGKYKLQNSSLCNFPHTPVMHTSLGQIVLKFKILLQRNDARYAMKRKVYDR